MTVSMYRVVDINNWQKNKLNELRARLNGYHGIKLSYVYTEHNVEVSYTFPSKKIVIALSIDNKKGFRDLCNTAVPISEIDPYVLVARDLANLPLDVNQILFMQNTVSLENIVRSEDLDVISKIFDDRVSEFLDST